jgi:hypothetical protein
LYTLCIHFGPHQGAFNSHLYPCYSSSGISILASDFNRPDVTSKWPHLAYESTEWPSKHFIMHIGHVDDALRRPHAKDVLTKKLRVSPEHFEALQSRLHSPEHAKPFTQAEMKRVSQWLAGGSSASGAQPNAEGAAGCPTTTWAEGRDSGW